MLFRVGTTDYKGHLLILSCLAIVVNRPWYVILINTSKDLVRCPYASEDSNAAKASVEKTIAADTSGATVVFIDATEAGLAANRERGLVSPGWWSYQTYTDAAGKTRHKAECLVNIKVPKATSETQADRLSQQTLQQPLLLLFNLLTLPSLLVMQ